MKGCCPIISIVESLVTSVCLFICLELNVNVNLVKTNVKNELKAEQWREAVAFDSVIVKWKMEMTENVPRRLLKQEWV